MAWFWMLFEPIAIIVVMIAIRVVVLGRGRHIAGAEFAPWLLVGLLGFFLFRENMQRSIGAIESHRGLYSYRQIQPIDPVLVRCYLEGMLKSFILVLLVAIGGLLGFNIFPGDFLLALFGWISLWMLGVGIGVFLSALSALVPEAGKIARIASLPLLIISGVIFPIQLAPNDLLEYLLLNPIAHGLEILRAGFFSGYYPASGVDAIYLWFWILGLLALGLTMQLRYKRRLRAL